MTEKYFKIWYGQDGRLRKTWVDPSNNCLGGICYASDFRNKSVVVNSTAIESDAQSLIDEIDQW